MQARRRRWLLPATLVLFGSWLVFLLWMASLELGALGK